MFSKDGYVHADDTTTTEDLKRNFGFSERQIAAMYSHFAWIITRLMIELGDDMAGKSYDPLSINYEEGLLAPTCSLRVGVASTLRPGSRLRVY